MIQKPKRANCHWTEVEKQALRELIGEYDDRQIGILLDRRTGGISAMRSTLGLKRQEQPEHLKADKERTMDDQQQDTGADAIHPAVTAVVDHYKKHEGDFDEFMLFPSTWNQTHHEMFKAAVRVWIEGDLTAAILHLRWMGMTKVQVTAGEEAMKAEMNRLLAEVTERNMTQENEAREIRWQSHKIRRLIRAEECDEPYVCCPVCSFHCTNMRQVRVIQGTQTTLITRDWTRLEPGRPAGWGRGSTVSILFCCEEGHLFLFNLHFHKGTTFVESIEVHEAEGEKESILSDNGQIPGSLWRD